MPRLCSDSSRPYPGRSAPKAVPVATGVGLRPTAKAVELPPKPKATGTAQGLATGQSQPGRPRRRWYGR
jgi:hypothetical protein